MLYRLLVGVLEKILNTTSRASILLLWKELERYEVTVAKVYNDMILKQLNVMHSIRK
jgi:hypothetical protein